MLNVDPYTYSIFILTSMSDITDQRNFFCKAETITEFLLPHIAEKHLKMNDQLHLHQRPRQHGGHYDLSTWRMEAAGW